MARLVGDTARDPDLVVEGTTADGSAVSGSGAPVLIAGQDGTNVQNVLTDTSGRPQVVGAGADGAAVAGNPNLIAGTDGTNVQTISVDARGRVLTHPGATIDTATVTVGSSATSISSANTSRKKITIQNNFTDVVAIGPSGVTLNSTDATDGIVLAAASAADNGSGGSITLETTAEIFGIGASASSQVIYITEEE